MHALVKPDRACYVHMMNTKKRRLTARLNVMMDPKLKRALQVRAQALGIDISGAARAAIEAFIANASVLK